MDCTVFCGWHMLTTEPNTAVLKLTQTMCLMLYVGWQVFATFDNFKRLPLADRASMAGLLYAMLDFERDPSTFEVRLQLYFDRRLGY